MHVCLNRYWLQQGITIRGEVFADILIEVRADSLFVLLLVGAVERIDAIVHEVEKTIPVDILAFIKLYCAWINSSKCPHQVAKDLLFQMNESVEHLHSTL